MMAPRSPAAAAPRGILARRTPPPPPAPAPGARPAAEKQPHPSASSGRAGRLHQIHPAHLPLPGLHCGGFSLLLAGLFYCLLHSSHYKLKEKLSGLGSDPGADATATYQCLVTCGKGSKQQQVWCQLNEDHLSDGFCNPSIKLESLRPCELCACASWQVGPWSSCTATCGLGYQIRAVKCVCEFFSAVLDDRECQRACRPGDRQVKETSLWIINKNIYYLTRGSLICSNYFSMYFSHLNFYALKMCAQDRIYHSWFCQSCSFIMK